MAMLSYKLPGIDESEITITLEPRVGPTNSLPGDTLPEAATAFCCHDLLHVRVPRREPMFVTVPVAEREDDLASADDQNGSYSRRHRGLCQCRGPPRLTLGSVGLLVNHIRLVPSSVLLYSLTFGSVRLLVNIT
eukprot:711985-Pyramimonas_sp.AAC.1